MPLGSFVFPSTSIAASEIASPKSRTRVERALTTFSKNGRATCRDDQILPAVMFSASAC